MPIFLLIRHAETDYNKKSRIASRLPGVHLNQKGKQQAQLLADKLGKVPIKAIHSSPLERAIETAEPLARTLNLEIVPNPGLLESDCGEWQDKSVKKLQRQKIWQSIQQHPSLLLSSCPEWSRRTHKHLPGSQHFFLPHQDLQGHYNLLAARETRERILPHVYRREWHP